MKWLLTSAFYERFQPALACGSNEVVLNQGKIAFHPAPRCLAVLSAMEVMRERFVGGASVRASRGDRRLQFRAK